MIRAFALLLLLLLASLSSFAQNAEIDSLRRVVAEAKSDTSRAIGLATLAQSLINAGQLDEAERTAQQGLDLSERIRFDRGIGWNTWGKAFTYSMRGQFVESLPLYHRARRLFERAKDVNGQARTCGNLGTTHYFLGNMDSAMLYQERASQLHLKSGKPEEAVNSLMNLAATKQETGDMLEGLRLYQKALDYCPKSNIRTIATLRSNMGGLYGMMGQHRQALFHFGKVVRTLDSCRCDYNNLAITLFNAAIEHGKLNEKSSRERALRRSYFIADSIGSLVPMALSCTGFVEKYIEEGRMDSVWFYLEKGRKAAQRTQDLKLLADLDKNYAKYYLHSGKPRLAREHGVKCLNAMQEMKSMEGLMTGYGLLTEVDSALGDFRSALKYYRLFAQVKDSLRSESGAREIGRLEAKFEAQQAMDVQKAERAAEQLKTRWALASAAGGLALLLVIAFTLFRGRQRAKRANAELRALNEEIQQQKTEIEMMNTELQATLTEVSLQRARLEDQHEKIEDSIRYASRIQGAILPSQVQLRESLPPHFVHYQPRDIVSGDFYWITTFERKTLFAVVDCTGHGIPGAFMSVLGSNLLHQIVDEMGLTRPAAILSALDRRITQTLRQQFGGDSKDGMDLALVVLHEADAAGKRIVDFAGAGRPLWLLHGGEIAEYKSARYACGGYQHEAKQYPATSMETRTGDRLYLFTDGATDQFGGAQGRKLGPSRLREFLLETAGLPIDQQGEAYAAFFKDWMGARKQIDDVLLAGIAL